MIRIRYFETEDQCISTSGQVEFEVFYVGITNLAELYKHSTKTYKELLDKKNLERSQLKDNMHEIIKAGDTQEIYITEDDIFFTFDEEILGIELYFKEYQIMTFIIIMYSEVEKLINNS